MAFKYGDVLRKKGRLTGGEQRVQFVRYSRIPGLSVGGVWFLGMTVRDKLGRLGGSRVGTIETFDTDGWVLDD